MDAMADFLRQAARDNGIPLTNAAVVLPSTEVFTRELTMPAMTEEDTRVTATLRVDEQAFTLSVPYGTAPTAEDVARLLTDNGISPDTIDSWTRTSPSRCMPTRPSPPCAKRRTAAKALPTPSPYPWTGWMMSPPSLPWRPITTSPSSCTWPAAATVTAAWC